MNQKRARKKFPVRVVNGIRKAAGDPTPAPPAETPSPTIAEKKNRPWWRRAWVAIAAAFLLATSTVGYVNNWVVFGQNTSTFVQGLIPKGKPPVGVSKVAKGELMWGYGPERAVFTMHHPADYAVLNSITDQTEQGDERNFVQIKEPAGRYADKVKVVPGDRLTVYAWVEDDAADNLADKGGNIKGLTIRMATGPQDTEGAYVEVIYDGINVKSVWDGALAMSDSPIKLQYIPDTLRFITNHSPKDGFVVPDSGFKAGRAVQLGETTLNGYFPVGTIDGKGSGTGYALFDVLVEAR